jgi:hypothetical protein
MPDPYPLWFGPLYGLLWLGVARFAVEAWRVSARGQRARTRREMLVRLQRWRHS